MNKEELQTRGEIEDFSEIMKTKLIKNFNGWTAEEAEEMAKQTNALANSIRKTADTLSELLDF